MRTDRRSKSRKPDPHLRRSWIEPLEGRVLLSTISGTVFSDYNGNGAQNGGEPGLSGVTVYLDANNNGVLDVGEPTTTTNANGAYAFTASTLKTYDIAQVLPSGFAQVKPVGNIVATQNIDVSKTAGNQAEVAIAIDPTNSNRMFMVSNVAAGRFLQAAYSTDGGATLTKRNVGTGSD